MKSGECSVLTMVRMAAKNFAVIWEIWQQILSFWYWQNFPCVSSVPNDFMFVEFCLQMSVSTLAEKCESRLGKQCKNKLDV